MSGVEGMRGCNFRSMASALSIDGDEKSCIQCINRQVRKLSSAFSCEHCFDGNKLDVRCRGLRPRLGLSLS